MEGVHLSVEAAEDGALVKALVAEVLTPASVLTILRSHEASESERGMTGRLWLSLVSPGGATA